MSTVVGEVSSLEGMVRAIESTTQSVRILEVGDSVFKDELIVTSSPANIMLVLSNGEVLILGRNSELFLDSDVFNDVISNDEAVADVATLQQFVLEGNFDVLEEPAAGVTGSPDSAIEEAIEVARTAAEGEVTAGFVTNFTPDFIPDVTDDLVEDVVTLGGALVDDDPFADDTDRGDEGLLANPDINAIGEDDISVEGNVILGTGASLQGADQLITDVNHVIDVNGVAVSDLNNNSISISGIYGSLEISSDGSYTYFLDNKNSTVQGLNDGQSIVDTFIYTIRDGDNDTSSTTLRITINGQADAPPVIIVEDVDGSLTVADNSVEEASGATVHGTITVSAEAGVASVTINGTDITAASAANPVLIPGGSQGLLTITGYDYVTGLVTYAFKEDGFTNDHSAGDNTVQGLYTVIVTDFAGVQNSDNLDIQILDTAPEANPDTNTITEDAINSSVGGNVITGSNGQGVNALSVDVLAADPSSVSDVNGALVIPGTPTEVTGLYGTLIFNSDGSYTYELDNSNPSVQALTSGNSMSESFTYTLSDNDGDSSSAELTITINGSDDGLPVIIDCDESVVEGLGNTVSGVFGVQAQAGIDTITVSGINIMGASVGSPVVIQGSEGDLTITGYNPLTGEVSYSYVIDTQTSDHTAGDNSVKDTFEVVATDLAGQTVVDYHDIQILDTAPVAVNDENSIVEDSVSVNGNVVVENDVIGTDTTVVTDINGTSVAPLNPGVVTGAYGTFTLSSDGSYVYFLDNSNPVIQSLTDSSPSLTDTVSYTITDADGDESTAVLKIIINGQDDAPPVIDVVDEDLNVSPADNSVEEGSADTITGTISVSADVGVASIQIEGVDVISATPTTPIIIPGLEGTLTIVGYNSTSGEVYYEYKEDGFANTHNAANDNVADHFFIEVTDTSGESTTDSLDIQILDTAPVAQADNNAITEDDNFVDGNVIFNTNNDAAQSDILGADDTVVTSIDGVSVSSGTATVSGLYGTLMINADGSYRYELNNSHPDIQSLNDGEFKEDTFEYVITDADGDTSTTTLTITINGQDDGAPTIDVEDADGQISTSDNSVVEGSGDTVTGTITVEAEAGIDSVSIAGETLDLVALAAGTPSVTIVTDNGDLVITGYNPVNGELSYEYTETKGAVDHTPGTPIVDEIEIIVTDVTGTATSEDLTIELLDSTPDAMDDSDSVTEDIELVATGSVLSNDNAVDQPLSVTPVALTGNYGTLTINAAGDYTYTLNNGLAAVQSLDASSTPLTESFNYTITDNDGSSDSAVLTISINGQDDGAPTIDVEDADGQISTSDNSVVEGSGDTVTGTITVEAEAGIDSVSIAGETLDLVALAAGTPSVTIVTDNGDLVITGYNPVNGELSYEYTETKGAVDHTPGTPIVDEIEIIVTDVTGTATSEDLTIELLDSTPDAMDDSDSVTEDIELVATGSVLSNDNAVDQPLSVTPVALTGNYGTLTINAAGDYTYTLNNGLAAVQSLDASSTPLTESFNYTITDNDGSSDSAVLTIAINGLSDAMPVITIEDTDGNVSPAHNSVEECSGNSVDGSISVNAEAGIATVTVGGVDITTATPNVPVVIQGTQGTLTVTSYNSVTGEITYTFTEDDLANDHSAGEFSVQDQFEIVVTDLLDQESSDTLNIQILDTAPVAVPDENNMVEPRFEIIPRQIIGFDIPDEYTRESNTDPYHGSYTINTNGVSNYRVVVNGKNIVGASSNNPIEIDMQYATIYITGFDQQTGLVEYTYIGDGRAITSPDDQPDKIETLVSAPVNESLNGNVLMGTGINLDGKDLYCDDSLVTAIDGGVLGAPLQGDYGTVTLNSDGSYEYILDVNHPDIASLDLGEQLSESFTYTITDADGDSSTTTLTITVDGQTEVPPTVEVVDVDGNTTVADNHVTEGSGDIITGSIFFNVTEDLSHIRIGGQLVYYNGFRSAEILGYEGTLTITGLDLNTGEITYRYKEDNSAADHRDGDDSIIESFAVLVADTTGMTAIDSLDIQIMDTAPIAVADVNTIDADDFDSAHGKEFHGYGYNASNSNSNGSQTTSDEHDESHEQGAPVVLGNVLTGTTLPYGSGPGEDIIGADKTAVTEVNGVVIGFDANPQFRGIEIEGQYGTLMMKTFGQYEYVLDTSNPDVIALDDNEFLNEVFNYTITDREVSGSSWEYGDSSTSTLTITINGSDLDSITFGGPLVVDDGHCMTPESSALMFDEDTMYMAESEHSSHEPEMLDLSELISDTDVSEESLSDYLDFMEGDSDEDHDSNDDHTSSDKDGCQVTQLEMETVMILDSSLDDQDEHLNGDYLNE